MKAFKQFGGLRDDLALQKTPEMYAYALARVAGFVLVLLLLGRIPLFLALNDGREAFVLAVGLPNTGFIAGALRLSVCFLGSFYFLNGARILYLELTGHFRLQRPLVYGTFGLAFLSALWLFFSIIPRLGL